MMKNLLKNNLKKLFISALALTFALSLFFGVSLMLKPQSVYATANVTDNISMLEGGSVRVSVTGDDKTGIGFITQINKEYYDSLSGNVSCGTLIVLKTELDKAGITDLTFENLNDYNATSENDIVIGDIVNAGWMNAQTAATDGFYQYRGSIVDLNTIYSGKIWIARSYVKVDDVYYYNQGFDATKHSRSIQDVVNAVSTTKATETETAENVYQWTLDKKYHPVSEADYNLVKQYDARAFNATVFNPETDGAYLYAITNGGTELTINSTVEEFDTNYTGKAVKFSQADNYYTYRIALPQTYFNKVTTEYVKIGMWYKFVKTSEEFTAANYDLGNGLFYQTVTQFASATSLDKFAYVEVDIDEDTIKTYWKDGVLDLFKFRTPGAKGVQIYLGEIKLLTQAEVTQRDEQAAAAEKANNLTVLTGITSDNAKYFHNGEGIFRTQTDITNTYGVMDGGYTGNAIDVGYNGGTTYKVQLPGDTWSEANATDNKYITMWFALVRKDRTVDMSGTPQFGVNSVTATFKNNFTYSSNGYTEKVLYPTNNTHDTWYQIAVPLSEAKSVLTAEEGVQGKSKLPLFKFSTGGLNTTNYTILIGDLEIVDLEPDKYLFKASIGGYSAINNDNAAGTITNLSASEVASEIATSNGYTGGAVKIVRSGNVVKVSMDFTSVQYEKYFGNETNYTKVKIWYAAGTSGMIRKSSSDSGYLMNMEYNTNHNPETGKWLFKEYDLQTVKSCITESSGIYNFKIAGFANTMFLGNIEIS